MIEEKRRQLLIDKPLQLYLIKLILSSCSLCIFAMLISSFGFYYSIKDLYTSSENPQLLQIIHLFNDYLWIYFIYVAASFFLCTLVIAYAWLVISNRLAGPVYRIRKSIESYLAGEPWDPVQLREHDAFSNLAESVNKLAESKSKQN